MNNKDKIKIILIILMIIGSILVMNITTNRRIDQITTQKEVIANPGIPYNIKVLNDHDVLLTTATDTIKLAFENAYNLSDEYVVYVIQY